MRIAKFQLHFFLCGLLFLLSLMNEFQMFYRLQSHQLKQTAKMHSIFAHFDFNLLSSFRCLNSMPLYLNRLPLWWRNVEYVRKMNHVRAHFAISFINILDCRGAIHLSEYSVLQSSQVNHFAYETIAQHLISLRTFNYAKITENGWTSFK